VGDDITSVVSIIAAGVGLAFAILALTLLIVERGEAKSTKERIGLLSQKNDSRTSGANDSSTPDGTESTTLGDDAKGLAELAKALKDLSRSLQAAFIAALFFLIAAGGGIGVAATDAAQTAADNGPATTTICTQGCQAGG
jgi:hypothetical protein